MKEGWSMKNSLNKEDLKKWGRNVLIFSSPVVLAFLVALQSGSSLEMAKGAAIQALIAAGIDLFRKFRDGV
jgi:hypothetical protein